MPNNNGIVQTQWSIDNTSFVVAGTLLKVFGAARLDDAQGNAVIAFAALGSSILVSPDRISDGLDALDPRGKYFRLERFAMMFGLHTGGIATLIRNEARQCVPAFLLATSLRTMMDDSTIGTVLFEMLSLQGLDRDPHLRTSRRDLTAIVSSLSGFGDTILPTQNVCNVELALRRVTTNPQDLSMAFAKPDSKQLAEIYSRVFGFLQDDDKNKNIITLRGISSCIAIASSLMWLREADVSLAVNGTTLITSSSSRIIMDLRTLDKDGRWKIQEWHKTSLISEAVVARDESWLSQKLPSFVPATSARTVIQARYNLDDT